MVSGYSLLQFGADRFRVGPWQADDRVAYVAFAGPGPKPSTDSVHRCADRLAEGGFRGAVTAALRSYEAEPFLACGFGHHERLHVLRHDLDDLTPPRRGGSRRARRRDVEGVLRTDHAAFPPFWRLDEAGLREAVEATPSARFRVVEGDDRGVVAYAVCGRSDAIGYLQRLAVHPDHAGGGIGTDLVRDALAWLRRRGGRQALVNTQDSNQGAVQLYLRLGFRLDPEQLHVLWRDW